MPNIADIIIAGSIFAAAGIILFRFFKKSKEGKGTCPCGSGCECSLSYNSTKPCHSCESCDFHQPCTYCKSENIKELYDE